MKWLEPESALERIKHPVERRLLRSVRVADVVRRLARRSRSHQPVEVMLEAGGYVVVSRLLGWRTSVPRTM